MFPPQTVKWQNEGITRHINSKHAIWIMAGQKLPQCRGCHSLLLLLLLLLLRALKKQEVLTNKNVMEGTMLWNDSINIEGDASCSHHNLHFKAHRHKQTKSRQIRVSSNSKFSPRSPANRRGDTCLLTRSHVAYWLLLCFSALWCQCSHNPCNDSAPSHAEIAEQRAVKGSLCREPRGH